MVKNKLCFTALCLWRTFSLEFALHFKVTDSRAIVNFPFSLLILLSRSSLLLGTEHTPLQIEPIRQDSNSRIVRRALIFTGRPSEGPSIPYSLLITTEMKPNQSHQTHGENYKYDFSRVRKNSVGVRTGTENNKINENKMQFVERKKNEEKW